MQNFEVVPAVIPETFSDLSSALASLRGVAPLAHIDLCDGRFVPRASWPFSGDGGEWADAVSQVAGFPFWEDFSFEFDVMAANPFRLAREAIEAGASRVILHLEAPGALEAFDELLEDGRAEVWLAGGVGLDLSPHLGAIGRADGFQQMGISKIGFQGQPFDPASLDGVRTVRGAIPELPLALDGGVSAETAAAIVKAGALKLVAGSAVLRAEDPAAAIGEIAAAAFPEA